jgi:mono/diheme cytochrome c family protein
MTPRTRFWLLIAILIAIAAAAYSANMVRRGFSTREAPSAVEAVLARTMREMSMPASVKNLANPWQGTPDVIAAGRAHFADHCATCHANDGSGNTEIGKNLYPPAPDMRLAATQKLTDGELYAIIRNGVRMSGMPAWGNPNLKRDDDSWHLVAFIRHLPQVTKEEIDEMQRLNPKTEADRAEEKQEQDFLNGSPGGPEQ